MRIEKLARNVLIYVVFSVFVFNSVFAVNSTYTNLKLDTNNWCANLTTTVTIYNASDYDNMSAIKDNLCVGNETPSEDDCSKFNIIQAKVKVFDGPIEGLPLLFNKTLTEKDNSKFNITFTNSNNYLVEIEPTSGKYNALKKTIFIKDCKFSQKLISQQNKIEKKLYNNSFDFNNEKISLILKNTNINSSSNISVKDLSITNKSLSIINNTIKIFEIESKLNQTNFSSLTIDVNFNYNSSSNISVYLYSKNSWNKINNFKKSNNKIEIDDASFGKYLIQEIKPKPKKSPITKKIVTNQQTKKNVSEKVVKRDNQYLLYFTLLVILLIGFLVFYFMNKKPSHKKINEEKPTESKVEKKEILTSYSSVYSSTKNYVQKYKNDYSKDAIYRVLKQANVPSDIIDKVFIEEF